MTWEWVVLIIGINALTVTLYLFKPRTPISRANEELTQIMVTIEQLKKSSEEMQKFMSQSNLAHALGGKR